MHPKGLYECECDSECAITRTDSLLQFKQRRRQPYNADIISTLAQRLRQNRSMSFKSTWVKAHQDDDKLPGQVLSDAALQNIRVDSIATDSTSRVDSLRPAPMLRMWTLRLSVYPSKEPGSRAGMRTSFVSILMSPTSAII